MKISSSFKTCFQIFQVFTFALILTSGHARSASTIQEETFSFLPNAAALMTFQRFDTMGGTRRLDSLFVEIAFTRTGGHARFDNESPSTATVDLTSRIGIFPTSGTGFTKLGSTPRFESETSLRTTASHSTTLGPDDDPEHNNFNNTGNDFSNWDLPGLSVSDSGLMNGTQQFVDTDSFSINLEGLQSESITGVTDTKKTTSLSSVSGFTGLTYNYTAISGLGERVLGPLGLAFLVLMRRQR